MANLKRAAALTLSAAMFLQPMTASAVTWGSVVQAINNHSNGGQTTIKGESPNENDIDILVDADGKATIKGGTIKGGVMVGGAPWVKQLADRIHGLIFKDVTIEEANDEMLGDYSVDVNVTEKNNIKEITFDENTTAQGNVMVHAFKDTQVSNAGMMEKMLQVDALDGATVNNENTGIIQGEFRGSAQGEGSKMTLTNQGTVEDALDGFSLGEGATTTLINEGYANELLANALAGGATTATNDGDVSLRTSGWSKGEGSSLTITNNGESGTMSAEAYLDGKASLTNNGLADGGMGGYTDGGRVDLVNNGEVNGNMAVGAEKEGHVSADNRESGTVYGDLKGWTDGVGSTAVISNSGDVAGGKPQLNGALMTLEARAPARISAVVALDADSETYHDDETAPESVTSEEAKPGTAGEGVLSGERRGSGTVVVEDKNSGTTSVNGKKADAMLNVTSSTTQAEIQSQLAALPIWEKPGEYTVLIKCVGENGEVTYEAVTILVEEEKPAEPMDTSEEAFRHEMEMKRQEEAIGGVYGSPYWVKQLYLGYHSYNLRLFVGETRENFREELSWSADGSKGVSLRVNDETPEKLTMRFDEKVLEVLERTNITTVTLLNRSGAAVMQYNVSDLRAAYDQYGLSDADQLVVGGMDDDVMKIGADGQLVPVE